MKYKSFVIFRLNRLLEKQSSLSHREKKLSNSPTSHKSVENEKNQLKALAEVYPRPVTPVYGCTISLLDDKSPKTNNSTLEEELSSLRRENNETMSPNVDNTKYGMALSLNGNLRKVVLLPVGVQVSLNQPELFEER